MGSMSGVHLKDRRSKDMIVMLGLNETIHQLAGFLHTFKLIVKSIVEDSQISLTSNSDAK